MQANAYANGKLVAEAELMAQIAKKQQIQIKNATIESKLESIVVFYFVKIGEKFQLIFI